MTQEDVLREIVSSIVRAVDPDRIILFGSRLNPSVHPATDYDILVLKRGVTNRRRTAQQIYLELSHIPAPVDIIVEDLDGIEAHRESTGFVYYDALRGRVLYEK
jgi:predicted nucleotidyltransferase